MLQIVYRLYHIKFGTNIFDRIYNRVLIRVANILLPVIFRITSRKPKNSIPEYSHTLPAKLIVSLTTYPARINKVWITIESILRQLSKPDMVILWLSKEEFTDRSVLPQNLLILEKRGLQIRFCSNNLMPHKKYFYAMQEFPAANIITMDDDVIYPPNLLKNFIQTHEKFPTSICSAVTRKITTVNGKFLPYKKWGYLKNNMGPSFELISIGAGGTFFPPGSLNTEVFNENKINQMALRTDDLWLKVMSLLNKTKVVSIAGKYPRCFIPVIQKNKGSLMQTNIGKFVNDKEFNDLMNYYHIPVSIFKSA